MMSGSPRESRSETSGATNQLRAVRYRSAAAPPQAHLPSRFGRVASPLASARGCRLLLAGAALLQRRPAGVTRSLSGIGKLTLQGSPGEAWSSAGLRGAEARAAARAGFPHPECPLPWARARLFLFSLTSFGTLCPSGTV